MSKHIAQKLRNSKYLTKTTKSVLSESIWSIFTPIALETKSINLGQGFPEHFKLLDDPSGYEALIDQSLQNVRHHQYTRSGGDPNLIKALERMYQDDFEGLDGMKNIVVQNGATQAIYTIIQTYVEEGDEVIVFEPFYDAYVGDIKLAGGLPVYVPIREPVDKEAKWDSNEWKIDYQELEKAVSKKTKMIILNNPHNPLGKVFSREELEEISRIAQKYDLLVLSDEVYEFLVFPDSKNQHLHIANLPGMWERTLTVGSAGKTFSTTGWKLGWILGPEELVWPTYVVNDKITFCVNSTLQQTLGYLIEKQFEDPENELFIPRQTAKNLQSRWKELELILNQSGLKTIEPHSGYFALASIADVAFPREHEEPKDFEFCRWLPKEIGVVSIPPSAFYSPNHTHLIEDYSRFAFCKSSETLQGASQRLTRLKDFI